jgi:hypothetical protein
VAPPIGAVIGQVTNVRMGDRVFVTVPAPDGRRRATQAVRSWASAKLDRMPRADQGAVAEILHRVERRTDEILARVNEEVAREILDYSASPERDAALRGVSAHGRAHLDAFVACARTGRAPRPGDLDVIDDIVRDRIRQQIPVAAVLHSFRIGHRATWDVIEQEAAEVPGGPSAAIALTRPSMDYIDAVSTRVAETYLAEAQRAVATEDRARRDLLDLLLAGSPDAGRAAQAAGVRLAPDAAHVVLVATVEGEPASRALAGRLTAVLAARHPLVVPRGPGLTGVLRATADELPAVTAQCAAAAGPARIGLSLAVPGLDEVPAALQQATSALALATPDRPVLALSQVRIVDYLLTDAHERVVQLVPPAVRDLVTSQAAFDQALVQTLLAYVDAGLNVKRAAATLPAHPNTVHHRLDRLVERTGVDLHDVGELMEIVLAVRLLAGAPAGGVGS